MGLNKIKNTNRSSSTNTTIEKEHVPTTNLVSFKRKNVNKRRKDNESYSVFSFIDANSQP